jgi:hypothetical protein
MIRERSQAVILGSSINPSRGAQRDQKIAAIPSDMNIILVKHSCRRGGDPRKELIPLLGRTEYEMSI